MTCHTPVVVHSVGSATVQYSVIFRESRAHLAKAALSSVSSLEWDLDLSLKLLHARVRDSTASYKEDALCRSQILSKHKI